MRSWAPWFAERARKRQAHKSEWGMWRGGIYPASFVRRMMEDHQRGIDAVKHEYRLGEGY